MLISTPWIAKAVADASRPADAVALDVGLKPAEVLTFLGLEPGMVAADIMTVSGYWAEIMANIVGPDGQVTAFEPAQYHTDPAESEVWTAFMARRHDIEFVHYPFENFDAGPRRFDFVMFGLTYHELYWESEQYNTPRTDPAAFLEQLYVAVKPGGIVGVIDHVGPAGDTRAVVDKLHRIDPAVVKADFVAAGFTIEAESPLLANLADDHDKFVFAPEIRGKTDRFLYRFRKPR